jgi:hypothetical protein
VLRQRALDNKEDKMIGNKIQIACVFVWACCLVHPTATVGEGKGEQSSDGKNSGSETAPREYRVGKHKQPPPPLPPPLPASAIEASGELPREQAPATARRSGRQQQPTTDTAPRNTAGQTQPVRAPAGQNGTGAYVPTAGHPVTDHILVQRLGSEKFQQFLQSAGSFAVPGKGSSSSSWKFDNAERGTGDDGTAVPAGSRLFQGHAPAVESSYQRGTAQDGEAAVQRYGSIPTGVVLEGIANLGSVDTIGYDQKCNALILDDRTAYFMRVPPKGVAALCRAIGRDEKERIGVALLEKTQIEYGELPRNCDVAWDLKMVDNFLGDIVFGQNDWSAGYRFPDGFKPEPNRGEGIDTAVFFTFANFEFQTADEELRCTGAKLDVKLLPLSQARTAQGGALPDNTAISQGRMSEQYEANARHLANNIGYYRRERIVDHTFAYGEVAAVLRALKRAGFDLEDLADHIPGG